MPSLASATLITGSATGTGGFTISASADVTLTTHDFGAGSVSAFQIILTNTSADQTTQRGNLLTGFFWTFSGITSLSTAIDGTAGTVKYLDPGTKPGPSDDQIVTKTNIDIAPAASGSGLYMLSNGPFGTANNNQDYSAYEYGIDTVGYGLTGFDGNAVDGDDYGIAANSITDSTYLTGGINAALGFDAIDHADALDAECIAAMHARGTFLVPSALYLDKLLAFDALRTPAAAPMIEATERELANILEQLPRSSQAGVKIVVGDDLGVFLMPHGSYAEELAFYVKRAHIPSLDVIRWATLNGAELAGRGHELGSVEPAKLADLLVVDGDPSVDITVLGVPGRLRAIVLGGAFVKDELRA